MFARDSTLTANYATTEQPRPSR